MYANRIYLVSNEFGVGVSNKGVLAAQAGDLTLQSNGQLVLAGTTNASGSINASATQGIDNSGTTYAQHDVVATTGGALTNSGVLAAQNNTTINAGNVASTGTLGAGVNSDGTIYADWFQGLGCRALSDIRRLPRAGLKKRCGVDLLDSLDRAYGLSPELYQWLDVPPTFSARTELPDRVEHAEAVLFSARRLIVQLCGWLSAQQLALTHATVSLEHERGRQAVEPTILEIALAEPTWHEEHLVRLLKERLGRTELPAAVLAVRLTASKVEPAEPPSDSLFPDPGGSTEDHNRLIELLIARLGAENVLRPAPTSDHRPEHANRWVPVQDEAKPTTPPVGLPRPTWLLGEPVRLMVKNHRPFYGSPLKLVSTGERIEAGWHDRELVTRDYYVAEAADNSCYWIYRERPSVTSEEVRWFLHGLFG
jgi:protein ImuB